MKVSFTLPTYKANGDKDDTVRNAEVTFSAEDCDVVTISAGGKKYRIRREDFEKVAKFINEEFC